MDKMSIPYERFVHCPDHKLLYNFNKYVCIYCSSRVQRPSFFQDRPCSSRVQRPSFFQDRPCSSRVQRPSFFQGRPCSALGL